MAYAKTLMQCSMRKLLHLCSSKGIVSISTLDFDFPQLLVLCWRLSTPEALGGFV
jgi:hypothetical protein